MFVSVDTKYKRTYNCIYIFFDTRNCVGIQCIYWYLVDIGYIYVSTKLSLYFFIYNLVSLHNITTLVHTQYINL